MTGLLSNRKRWEETEAGSGSPLFKGEEPAKIQALPGRAKKAFPFFLKGKKEKRLPVTPIKGEKMSLFCF